MKDIRQLTLISLTIHNFKGIRELHHEFSGSDTDVFAKNGTGKTTLFDAVCWLFSGKDSEGKSKFECKVIDTQTGEPIHFLEHSVEVVIGTPDGPVTLKKQLTEDWVTQRGSTSKTFQGHTCKYWVNTVPLPENQFLTKLDSVCPRNLIELLGNPEYFNVALDWKKRRETLLAVCGDVTDEDVISSNPDLAGLAEAKANLTIEEFRSVCDEHRKLIDKEIKLIPVKVSEAERAIIDVENLPTPDQIESLRSKLSALREERAGLATGGGVAQKTTELRTLEAEGQDILNRINSSYNEMIAKTGAEARARFNVLAEAEAKLRNLLRNIEESNGILEKIAVRRSHLLDELRSIQDRTFSFTGEDACPSCGQSLPADKVAGARDQAESEFNLKKSRDLELNMSEGLSLKEKREAAEKELADFTTELESVKASIESIKVEHQKLESELRKAESSKPNPLEDGDYVANLDNQRALKEDIEKLKSGSNGAIIAKDEEIQAITAELQTAERLIATHKQGEVQRARIAELMADEKKLASQYEEQQANLFMCDEFVRTKVALLTERINSKFKLAKFKLFEQQVNGGLRECCDTLVDFVPYSTNLNTASKVNVGLDIINTLAEHYGVAPFVFIDRVESVDDVLPTTGQQIRLIVNKADKSFRFVEAKTAKKVSA